MADVSQNPLFSLLAARYGLGTALQLLNLVGGQQSPVGQGLGATQAAGTGLGGLGFAMGSPQLAELGRALGLAAGAGGLGYGLYSTLSDPNLSAGQKAGTAALQSGEGAVALSPAISAAVPAVAPALAPLAAAAPYLAAFLATQAVGGAMEKSGSPQIRAGGRQVLAPLLPITNFLNVVTGRQSPRAAANATIQQMGQVPVVGKPLGSVMRFFGLGTKPTQGHEFRTELESLFGQIPALKGLNASQYRIPTAGYQSFDPKAVSAAEQLGKILAAYAPTGKAAPDQYALQTENILLNKYGNQMPQIMAQVLPLLGGQAAGGTASATGAAPASGSMMSTTIGSNLPAMLKSLVSGQRTL